MMNQFAQNSARCPIGSISMSFIPMLGKPGLFGGKKRKNKKHNFKIYICKFNQFGNRYNNQK